MAIEANAGILGGKPVIQGTRIPVDLLLELVDAGLSVDDIWSKFRASVFEKHGSLKVLSKEVEHSLRLALQEGDVLTFLARLSRTSSAKGHARPRLKGPPAEVDVRELRRRRFESLSGY